jgi:hypothetical protein
MFGHNQPPQLGVVKRGNYGRFRRHRCRGDYRGDIGRVRYGTVRYGYVRRPLDVRWMSAGRREGGWATAGALPGGVGAPLFNEPPGILHPIMHQEAPLSLVEKPRLLEGLRKRRRVALPHGGVGQVCRVIPRHVAILCKVQRPMPEEVQVPDHGRDGAAE